MTDFDYVTHFERYLLTERRVARNTFDAYKRDLAQFMTYVHNQELSLPTTTETTIKTFLKQLKTGGLTARSMARKLSCLKSFFTYLHDHHTLANPVKNLQTPKLEKKLPHYGQEKDIEKLLDASNQEKTVAGARNRVMLYLLYASGMRISELVNATIAGIDFSENCITITGKGSKERIIPLPEPIMNMLYEYLEVTHPRLVTKQGETLTTTILFPTFYGGALRPVTRQSFWLYLKDLAKTAGLTDEFSPHMLRHSLATHLLKRGVNLRSLQTLLGHEKLTTVQIYTHVETSHLRKLYDKKHPRS